MGIAVAIQMDAMESIDIAGDSTFALALEGQARGHALFHYLPADLSLQQGRVVARARALEVRPEAGNHFTLGGAELFDLANMDVVLMRQDPPFDMAYITATHLLEQIHPKTLVVNDPAHVRNAPEKLFVTRFENVMPPTLITSDAALIHEFRAEYLDIVVKPLFGNGGVGVFHIGPEDENLNALLEMFTDLYREPIIVQKYLPQIRQGDKRIILVDGTVAGAVSRVPAAGEARANLHVGARAEKTELTPREREICAAIGPALRERGLIFVGIDVIGDFLTEINVTSPTGIMEINRLDDARLDALVWDAIEARLGAGRE
ncbi:MAG: glutathione synthase [Alphaproteobacteria bacterium]|jgi:glutathione synthase|nr:glutathione synthase [Alphaproteobacteria bacterium]MDP6588701.1 glutathione synthase [Alphaproteobacteria bacterium]MDP6818875.1 glutathione synthase [Alphaproteobacteria bacterium]|tara:strand:+ start:1329 stop:2282 length:954 start_codon:yes stop_codon:yes gene_type:complete